MAQIICDSCEAKLQVGAASLGKKIRCPKCKATFTAKDDSVVEDFDEIDEEEEEEERPKKKGNAKRAAADDDEDEDRPRKKQSSNRRADDDDDRPAKKRGKKKKKGGKGLVIGLIIGGVLLLGGGGVLAYFLISGNSNSPGQSGGTGKPTGGLTLSIYNAETWTKLSKGMTRQQAEAILGTGTPRQLLEQEPDPVMDFIPFNHTGRFDTWQKTISKGGVMLVWIGGKSSAIQLLIDSSAGTGKVIDGSITLPIKNMPGGMTYTGLGTPVQDR